MKKLSLFLTIAIFILSTGCYSNRSMPIDMIEKIPEEGILKIMLKSGEEIKFLKPAIYDSKERIVTGYTERFEVYTYTFPSGRIKHLNVYSNKFILIDTSEISYEYDKSNPLIDSLINDESGERNLERRRTRSSFKIIDIESMDYKYLRNMPFYGITNSLLHSIPINIPKPAKVELSFGFGLNSLGVGRNLGVTIFRRNHSLSVHSIWSDEFQFNYMAYPDLPFLSNYDILLLYGNDRIASNRILIGVGYLNKIRRGTRLELVNRHTTLKSKGFGLYLYIERFLSSNRTFNTGVDLYTSLNSREILVGVEFAVNIAIFEE